MIFPMILLLMCIGLSPLAAQRFTAGMTVGTAVTDDFHSSPDSSAVVMRPAPRSLLIGPTIEFGLSRGWSVEAGALHRKLAYSLSSDFQVCVEGHSCKVSTSTWEFPILLKYRFSTGRWHPFVAAGPSFRTSSTLIQTRPSSHGVTSEIGVEIPAGRLRFDPGIRLTHWGGDGVPFAPTVRNQVEALVKIHYMRQPQQPEVFGKRIWVGLMVGVPLTHDFGVQSVSGPYTGQAERSLDFRSAAGLMAEAELSRGISVEVNGLYRRLHYQSGPEVVLTWEIPLLAKYTFSFIPLRPFVGAGVSFRPTGNLNDAAPAHYGTTTGAGIEMRWKRLRMTPSLRYTRWSADGQPLNASASVTKRDQVELLVGFSF